MVTGSYHTRARNQLLLIYFLFYYAILLGFFLDDRLLFQYRPIFFNYNRDLTELWLIATGLPQWMIAHPGSFALADGLALVLPVLVIRQYQRGRTFSPWPGIVFVVYLALYFLLADIFWQMHVEPFLILLLLALAWTTDRPNRFYNVMTFCRYYFLYAFASAAIWKIARGAVFNGHEMSRILLLHHTDLLTGSCTSVACRAYGWLIAHPGVSQILYAGAALLEAVFLIGLFTRRWDRLLILLAILFVIADLLLMRIPYWPILLGCIPLWLRPTAAPVGKKAPPGIKKIVLYETTHHENLPALLDLCEAQFNQVAVFLKALSWQNLTGEGSPEQRWPRTDFFIQTTDCPNRRFIGQLFRFIRRHGFTHLHLCTLDNNLLFFTVRLTLIGPVHLSLTVHEINEYFSRSYTNIRACTESIARPILHRLIRHYHVFLPAMADQLRQRLPGSTGPAPPTVVFIPSRFYSGRHPLPAASPFKVVIPGSLDSNRRNYEEVIQTLALWQPIPGTAPIELVLLGDSTAESSDAILAGFRSIDPGRFTLRHFKGYIPQTTYEAEITTAHLIWSPLNIHKRSSRNTPETYGLSTASGLTADLLLGNAPALVPAGFIIPEPFRAAIYPYRSPEEAQELIRGFIGDPASYAALRATIHRAFCYFSKENFSTAFSELTAS